MINKIGIISSSPQGIIGGSEISASLLAKNLAKQGYNIYIASFPANNLNEKSNEYIKILSPTSIRFQELHAQPLTLLIRIIKMIKIMESYDVDIIHIYNVFPMAAAGLYKYFGGKMPIVATLNNFGGICPNATYLCNGQKRCNVAARFDCIKEDQPLIFKLFGLPYSAFFPIIVKLMKNLDAYIALSLAVKNIYAHNGYDADKIKIIPNCIDNNLMNNEIYETQKANRECLNILYVGAINREKGIDILLKAFALLVGSGTPCYLTIVGDGALLNKYKNLAETLGILKQVNFVGKVPYEEVVKFYKNADVFVHPGVWNEPFARTVLEAMGFGLPCIVSDIGAPPELVGTAGLIFTTGDSISLYNKLIKLYTDIDLRIKLSANCAKEIRKYTSDIVTGKIIRLYKDVAKHGWK